MNKFNIGDQVTQKGDLSNQVREVLSIMIKPDGVYYDVTSREVDIKAKDVVNGHLFVKEEELELYVEESIEE